MHFEMGHVDKKGDHRHSIAFQHIDEEQQHDSNFMIEAIKRNFKAIKYAA